MGRDYEYFVCNIDNDMDFISIKINLNLFCFLESVLY